MKKREIKFRYVFKDKNGELSMEEWSIEEIEEMELEDNHTIKNPFLEIVARLESTGLKDVNGKMIFEGDVIGEGYIRSDGDYKYGIRTVKWEKDGFNLCQGGDDSWEIIGNVFENPELLK